MSQLDPRELGDFLQAPTIALARRPIVRPDSKIFTMGSCFAKELRKSLTIKGFKVFPDYLGIDLNDDTQHFDLRGGDMAPHFDTFVMRQELEAAAGLWADRAEGFYAVRNNLVNKLYQWDVAYQDPYRERTYASSMSDLIDMADKTTACIRQGLDTSDIVILTLGLTEVWRHTKTGKYFLRAAGTGWGGGLEHAEFRRSTFLENYENLRAILEIIFARDPNKNVVISVSPVRLQRTFSNVDIGTANLESKSILRALAGQICREYGDRVTYFPSYEMALLGVGALTGTGKIFQEDGAHVRPEFAEKVIATFQQMFS